MATQCKRSRDSSCKVRILVKVSSTHVNSLHSVSTAVSTRQAYCVFWTSRCSLRVHGKGQEREICFFQRGVDCLSGHTHWPRHCKNCNMSDVDFQHKVSSMCHIQTNTPSNAPQMEQNQQKRATPQPHERKMVEHPTKIFQNTPSEEKSEKSRKANKKNQKQNRSINRDERCSPG